MVSSKKKLVLLCSALMSTSNLVYGLKSVQMCHPATPASIKSEGTRFSSDGFWLKDFLNDLFGISSTSTKSQAKQQKQLWSDIQREIETTTPQLHEVAYLLDQMRSKNRENLAAALESIDATQQQLSKVKARLEDHVASSNGFGIQEEQTADALTINIATPGFDSKNISVLVSENKKILVLEAKRLARNTFSYASTECNSVDGRQATTNYENGTLNVSITLPDNIEYTQHNVEFGDDEVVVTFPFHKSAGEEASHEHVGQEENFSPNDTVNSKEDEEEGNNEEESEEK